MGSFKRRIDIKWFITFFLIVMLSVAVIFAFVKIGEGQKTKTLGNNSFTYSIGHLDLDGEYEQGTQSIYMKNLEEVDGLTCELDEDSTITYKVFFYNADKEFISNTDSMSENFESSNIPEDAEYFRVVITPTNDPEVQWREIGLYAGQLTVSVNK